MKKAILFLAAAAMFASLCAPPAASAAAAGETGTVYLGENAGRGGGEVFQSFAAAERGESSVRYGLELTSQGENKFLRMANFDGVSGSGSTSVCFGCMTDTAGSATVRFRYRLSEGEAPYADGAAVFALSFRGAEKTFSFGDLTPVKEENMEWRELSCTLNGLSGNSGRLTLTFFYSSHARYEVSRLFADVDDVSVRADGKELALGGGIESGAVTASDEVAYQTPAPVDGELLLSGEDAVRYEENTVLAGEVRFGFNDGERLVPLARQGSAGTFRGAASVSAKESDVFAVYDPYEQNTFLRLSNKNGAAGVRQTRFYTYFYDNATGTPGNLPLCEQIFFSFRYRLFLDGYVRAGLKGNEPILHFSTRSSGVNHAGEISLDELTVNEAGDPTWHTYSGVLDVRRSSTAYMIVTYYAHAESAFAETTFLDFDGLTLSASQGGKNYAHLGGEFEGLAEGGEESGELFFRSELGAPAAKTALDPLDSAMRLGAGQTFSVRTAGMQSGVLYCAFSVKGDRGAPFELYCNGRNGNRLSLAVGQNASSYPLSVQWTEENGAWRCRIYYARTAYFPLSSLDFVNPGEKPLQIDDLRAGQVLSVCTQAGDRGAYTARLSELKAQIEADPGLKTSSRLSLARLLYLAESVGENASEARMQSALGALEEGYAAAERLADVAALEEAIQSADRILEEQDLNGFTNPTRLKFLEALKQARLLSTEDSQTAIDGAARALSEAAEALTPIQTGAAVQEFPAVAVAAGTGGAVGCGALVGAILYKRRKKA